MRVLVFFGQNNLIPTSRQALKSFCLRIWARRVGSSQPALGGLGPGEYGARNQPGGLLFQNLSAPAAGLVFFPNETSFWGTPLRIKEIAGDRRATGVSGPNPPAEFVRVRVLVFFGQSKLIPPSKQALKSFCLRIWARRVGSSQPALGGFGPGE